MCGFAGIVHTRCKNGGHFVDQALLHRMTGLIKHRGPDDEGYLLLQKASGDYRSCHGTDSLPAIKDQTAPFPNSYIADVGMGFRRLSILDLSEHGHQPMSLSDGSLHIVFNGEIYNYLELSEELKSLGCSFFSNTDTEVILHAYRIWGRDCCLRFIGMWAFAILNCHTQELFCSRDPYGIKPFYYSMIDGVFYFASEIKQLLLCSPDFMLNHTSIWRSMKINAMLSFRDETFWQGISALEPGHTL
ncbi:MAG: asparagine synthetase B, partial [Candidatus Cloacimonadaceae bacterium]|nr:asparagine synthetase B [Candidatus Cloacimonadaceae bacterium]